MTCAYVSIDLTGVRRQGPGGSSAEGEMIAVGMVYNPVPEDRERWAAASRRRPPWQARYVTSAEGQEAVAEPLRHMASRVGTSEARRWIAVCDASSVGGDNRVDGKVRRPTARLEPGIDLASGPRRSTMPRRREPVAGLGFHA